MTVLMAGGGTGGHVIPALAVAREVVRAGHEVLFVGTERGVEARLVPAAGFRLEKIRVGGMKNLGIATKIFSLWRLLSETAGQVGKFREWKPAVVFSMGGYVAGPPVLAALVSGVPVVVMEPNAAPGATNRWIGRWVKRALISFAETARYFPKGRTELTGLPVREEFFLIPIKSRAADFVILITGGSQGSQKLNEAARASWRLFEESALPVRFIHQTGLPMYQSLADDFAKTGLPGEVHPFISDMPAAFAHADLVICRAGAGAVSELAAAGKPSILVPFPFAADDHQLKNAQAFARAGAAILSLDRHWDGRTFFELAQTLCNDTPRLREMGEQARTLAFPKAAVRATEILLKEAIDRRQRSRNNS